MIGRHDSVESMAFSDIGSQYSLLIDKQPIVCADGLMMKCSIVDNSYVPEQMINFEEFMASIRRAIDVLKTPESSPNLGRRCKEESMTRRRSLSLSDSSLAGGSSTSSPIIKRTNSASFSNPRTRSSSFKSGKASPQSILLKAALKPKDLDRCSIESESSATEEERFLKEKYTAQIKGFSETDSDYVYMETLHSILEASAILGAIIDNKVPTVVDLEISNDTNMTLCYQAVNNFKQEFMMLKLKSDYCLFLAPF